MMFEIILHFQGSDTVQGVEKEDPEPFDAKKHLAVSSSATNCHRNTVHADLFGLKQLSNKVT